MKKLIISISLIFIFIFNISFGYYAPTKKDQKLLDQTYKAIDIIAQKNPERLDVINSNIELIISKFNINSRIYYILTNMSNYLDQKINDYIANLINSKPKDNITTILDKLIDGNKNINQTISCNNNQHLESNACVDNYKNCFKENGDGVMYWNNGTWGQCFINKCDAGFTISNNSCQRNTIICSSDQHLENNVCIDNNVTLIKSNINSIQNINAGTNDVVLLSADVKISQPINLGDITLYLNTGSSYAGYATLASSYSSLKLKVGNNIVAIYTPSSSDTSIRFDGNFSVPSNTTIQVLGNTKSTAIGVYLLQDLSYTNFGTKEYLNGKSIQDNEFIGSISGITTKIIAVSCNNDQHLENGICVYNKRYCYKENGKGIDEWINGYRSNEKNDICLVQSCNEGYIRYNTSCVKLSPLCKYEDFRVGVWYECKNGKQRRTIYTNNNLCNPYSPYKPIDTQNCDYGDGKENGNINSININNLEANSGKLEINNITEDNINGANAYKINFKNNIGGVYYIYLTPEPTITNNINNNSFNTVVSDTIETINKLNKGNGFIYSFSKTKKYLRLVDSKREDYTALINVYIYKTIDKLIIENFYNSINAVKEQNNPLTILDTTRSLININNNFFINNNISMFANGSIISTLSSTKELGTTNETVRTIYKIFITKELDDMVIIKEVVSTQ